MRNIIAFAALLASSTAAAQVAYPPGATSVDIAAIQAQIPRPATSVPPADMAASGVPGTSPQYRPIDAQAPRISRTVSGTTTTGGTGTVTWPAMSAVPKLTVTPYAASAALQAPICVPVAGTITTTGATIKCWSTQAITVSVLGAVVAPVTTAAAGIQFDVLALPAS